MAMSPPNAVVHVLMVLIMANAGRGEPTERRYRELDWRRPRLGADAQIWIPLRKSCAESGMIVNPS